MLNSTNSFCGCATERDADLGCPTFEIQELTQNQGEPEQWSRRAHDQRTLTMRARQLQQSLHFGQSVFRISEHTKLRNIETFFLDLFVDAQGPDDVHQREN